MKNKFAHLGRVLTREEAKLIVGGDALVDGDGCKQQYEYDCSINGGGNPSDQCCSGVKCVLNGTGTGTICM